MNFDHEFGTVDHILATTFETRGVDAFTLAFIKAEKQMRRVFTFLVFQNKTYSSADYQVLRKALADNRQIYFGGFIQGINLLLPRQLSEVYGVEYDKDLGALIGFEQDRNKIFHGQITANGLSRPDLINRVAQIKKWCKQLSEKLAIEIGYNGFNDSFQKTTLDLKLNNQDKIDTIEKYRAFLKSNMTRSGVTSTTKK